MFAKARQLLLGGLSALWGGSLLGGFVFGTAEKPGAARIPKPLALLSSATLVAAAWLIRSEKRRGPAADYSHQIAKGMTWGFLGDLAMTFSVPLGMVTFGLGHIEYVRGMWRLGKAEGLDSPLVRAGAWLTWLGIGVAGWYFVVHCGPKGDRPLAWVALPYTLLLASTAGMATGLALQRARYIPLAVGGALFLLSDLVIAMRLFHPELFAQIPDSLRGDLIWLTYGPAQALIVSSALLASDEEPVSK
ncbi:MAG: lysoplasmalogenase [Myxococcales bacterium]|jgi:hypothetical protein|nr:lysoplasmalogenase [Myxococcales bacterium]